MSSSLFGFFEDRGVKPRVGDIITYASGRSIEIIAVDKDYVRSRPINCCEQVCDLSKATLFRKGRFIPKPGPFKPEGDCEVRIKQWEPKHD